MKFTKSAELYLKDPLIERNGIVVNIEHINISFLYLPLAHSVLKGVAVKFLQMAETYSEPCQKSKMESFAKKGSPNFFAKRFILDLLQGSENPWL